MQPAPHGLKASTKPPARCGLPSCTFLIGLIKASESLLASSPRVLKASIKPPSLCCLNKAYESLWAGSPGGLMKPQQKAVRSHGLKASTKSPSI